MLYNDEDLVRIVNGTGKEYSGISEPNPMAYDRIKKLFPNSPIIYVYRDPDDSLKSMCETLHVKDEKVINAVKDIYRLNEKHAFKIQEECPSVIFGKIDEEVAELVWLYCIGIKPDRLRISQLCMFNVKLQMNSIRDAFNIRDKIIKNSGNTTLQTAGIANGQ